MDPEWNAERERLERLFLASTVDRGLPLPPTVGEQLQGWPRRARRERVRLSSSALSPFGYRLTKVSRRWRVLDITEATWSR